MLADFADQQTAKVVTLLTSRTSHTQPHRSPLRRPTVPAPGGRASHPPPPPMARDVLTYIQNPGFFVNPGKFSVSPGPHVVIAQIFEP